MTISARTDRSTTISAAYFSGIACTSLYGWFRALAALLGTPSGIKLTVVSGIDARKPGAL